MIVSCARLPGNVVVNRHGEDLGRVDRIMIDPATGRIAYVVLAYGGVLGLGVRHCAIEWEDLILDGERRCFVLDRAPGELAERPLPNV